MPPFPESEMSGGGGYERRRATAELSRDEKSLLDTVDTVVQRERDLSDNASEPDCLLVPGSRSNQDQYHHGCYIDAEIAAL